MDCLAFYNLTENFPSGGTVAKFWYNGFLIVWNAGLRDAWDLEKISKVEKIWARMNLRNSF